VTWVVEFVVLFSWKVRMMMMMIREADGEGAESLICLFDKGIERVRAVLVFSFVRTHFKVLNNETSRIDITLVLCGFKRPHRLSLRHSGSPTPDDSLFIIIPKLQDNGARTYLPISKSRQCKHTCSVIDSLLSNNAPNP
jgi:hypothetical protein